MMSAVPRINPGYEGERPRVVGGGDPPNNGGVNERVAKLEAVLPYLASKSDIEGVRTDIHKLESTFVKWSIGVGFSIVGLIVVYLTLTKPQAISSQPIVIQLPSSPASQPATAPAQTNPPTKSTAP